MSIKVKNEDKTTLYVVLAVILAVVFYFGIRLGTLVEMNDGEWSLEVIDQASNIWEWIPPIITGNVLMIAGFLTLFAWMCFEAVRSTQRKNKQEEAFGSAKWNTPDFTKDLREKEMYKNWIFTETEIVSKSMSKTKRNRNCTVIGRPGTGKSRYWLIPNLLNADDETIVVTDPKEEILKAVGKSLQMKGYDIRVLNIKSKWRSNHYNPFQYIRKLPKEALLLDLENEQTREELVEDMMNAGRNIAEDDVMALINSIMENTKSATIESNTGDPFWEKAEMVFLQAIFYYVIFNYPKEDRNFRTVLSLIREAQPDDKGNSALRQKFENWKLRDPNNIGVKQWEHFFISAKTPKTMSTILMTASSRLAPFNLREVDQMTYEDTMELDRIGMPLDAGDGKHGKVAYFIISDPNNNAFNFLMNLMYSQIFSIIDQNAGDNGGRLATPVNVYMDEFKQQGKINRFLEFWAYCRGLDCGVTIILQSLAQLKELYKDGWETALDCCDYILFLGSRSKETLEYMSTMLGKQTLYKKSTGRTYSSHGSTSQNWDVYGTELAQINDLAELEAGHGILMMAGTKPFYSKLYNLEKSEHYDEMWEAWTEQDGEKDPEFKKSEKWKINHAKLYDHLEELKNPSIQEYAKQKALLAQIGLKCTLQEPLTTTVTTVANIDKQYGNSKKISIYDKMFT